MSRSAPMVDGGLEVLHPPWPRTDDPKQVYTDPSAGSSTPQVKPENTYAYPSHEYSVVPSSSPRSKKFMFGLGIAGWSVLLVAGTATIIGAAVGGGLGSALSSCNSQKSDLSEQLTSCSGAEDAATGAGSCQPSVSGTVATATITISASESSGTTIEAPIDLSNFVAVDPVTIENVYTGCPGLNDKTHITTRGDAFVVFCDRDSNYGSPSLEDPALTLQVFAGFVAYTLEDCMEACSSFNAFSTRNDEPDMRCRSVTFNHWMSDSLTNNGFVNCWIKNATLAESDLHTSSSSISCMMQA